MRKSNRENIFHFFKLILPFALISNLYANDCSIKIIDNFPSDKLIAKLNDSIGFLAKIEGTTSSELHREFFEGMLEGQTYCNFLNSKIRDIKYFDNKDHWGLAYNDFGTLMISKELLMTWNKVEIASALIHEAFHSNFLNGYKGHVQCPNDFYFEKYRGKEACDDQLYSSYAAQYIWTQNLVRNCTNCSNEELNSLESIAYWTIKRIISDKVTLKLLDD